MRLCLDGLRGIYFFQEDVSLGSLCFWACDMRNRDKVFDKLRVGNIGVSLHYIPIYLHPYYEKLGYRKGLCPKAEKYFKETMTLPLFPKMSNSEIKKVITAVKNAVGNL